MGEERMLRMFNSAEGVRVLLSDSLSPWVKGKALVEN